MDYKLYESLFKSKKRISISVGVHSAQGMRPTMEDEHLYIANLDQQHSRDYPNFIHPYLGGRESQDGSSPRPKRPHSGSAPIQSPSSPGHRNPSKISVHHRHDTKKKPALLSSPLAQRYSIHSPVNRRRTGGSCSSISPVSLPSPKAPISEYISADSGASVKQSPFRKHCMFAVFDGHSGREAATFCKDRLYHFVYRNENYFTNVDRALREGFLECDLALRRVTESKRVGFGNSAPNNRAPHFGSGAVYSAGTTACVSILRDTELIVANVGDSRAVLAHSGKCYEMSDDHKPTRHDERKRIEAAGGVVLMGRVNGTLAVCDDTHCSG